MVSTRGYEYLPEKGREYARDLERVLLLAGDKAGNMIVANATFCFHYRKAS